MEKITQYLELIEQVKAGDIEGALEKMSDDIVLHAAVGMVPPMRGKAMVRQWLQGAAHQSLNSRWRVVSHMESADRLFVEGIEEYDTPEGDHVVVPYAGVFDYHRDKICAWRDYFHGKLLRRDGGSGPIKDHVLELAARPAVTRNQTRS